MNIRTSIRNVCAKTPAVSMAEFWHENAQNEITKSGLLFFLHICFGFRMLIVFFQQ